MNCSVFATLGTVTGFVTRKTHRRTHTRMPTDPIVNSLHSQKFLCSWCTSKGEIGM